MSYIDLPLDIQLIVAQFLGAMEPFALAGLGRLFMACSTTQQHLTAVASENSQRYETAANAKGTYIATAKFNDFCADKEREGTLDKHRFSLFVCSAIRTIHYRANGIHYNLQHINARSYLYTYHDIVFKPSEFASYTPTSGLVLCYVKHHVQSYAVGNTKHWGVFQCLELEQRRPDAPPQAHTCVGITQASLIGYTLAIRYTVV